MPELSEQGIEAAAREIEPLAWAALRLCDTVTFADRRGHSVEKARAAITAYLKVTEMELEPETIQSLQRRIGLLQQQLHRKVCGDPSRGVTMPMAE